LEAFRMHPALDRADAVREGVDALVVAGVPLPRDLDLALGFGGREVADVLEQGLLALVEVADEVRDAAVVAERLVLLVALAPVVEPDREAAVEEGRHLQVLENRRGAELRLLEDVGIGPEG